MKDIQQLIKKNSQEGRYEDIFPKTFIDAVLDKESGVTLTDILAMFNMLFLSYNGSRSQTRLQVPSSLRREGLWVTYVLYDKTVVTEWYSAGAIDDTTFGDSANWRDGSNALVGDISISSDGYWVINGEVTTIKAQGETGITPILRVGTNNHLQVSYTNGSSYVDVSPNPVFTQFRINNNKLEQSIDLGNTWTIASDYIAAWFKFTGTTGSSQADNVGKIQISRDNGATWSDLSGEFTNSLHIKGYVATVGALPSTAVQGDIYGVGPTYDSSDTEHTNPIYQLYVKDSTGWVNNGRFTSIAAGVVQTTGTSTTEVMSQDAVTRELTDLELGVIYDVSAHNDGAVFESLSTLLGSANLSTLIPTSVRRGGMSIRFIQGSVPNSDKKYVQYRLMANTFSTTESDWQGVDTEPSDNKNLVESRGVDSSFKVTGLTAKKEVRDTVIQNYLVGQLVRNDATVISESGYGITLPYQVQKGQIIAVYLNGGAAITSVINMTDANHTAYSPKVISVGVGMNWYYYIIEEDGYVSFCFYKTFTYCYIGTDLISKDLKTLTKNFNDFVQVTNVAVSGNTELTKLLNACDNAAGIKSIIGTLENGTINPYNGSDIATSAYRRSGYIPVNTGIYCVAVGCLGNINGSAMVAGYSTNYASGFVRVLAQPTVNVETQKIGFTIPEGVSYIRVSFLVSGRDDAYLYGCWATDSNSLIKNYDSDIDALRQEDYRLEEEINSIEPVIINNSGTINNAADEEDITVVSNLLKFKNRAYGNGMGYKILRSTDSLASQLTSINTIYEVRYHFDLEYSDTPVVVPTGSILYFNGGNISNGYLNLNGGRIISEGGTVFSDVVLSNVKDKAIYASWFGMTPDVDSAPLLEDAIRSLGERHTLYIDNDIQVSRQVEMPGLFYCKIEGIGNHVEVKSTYVAQEAGSTIFAITSNGLILSNLRFVYATAQTYDTSFITNKPITDSESEGDLAITNCLFIGSNGGGSSVIATGRGLDIRSCSFLGQNLKGQAYITLTPQWNGLTNPYQDKPDNCRSIQIRDCRIHNGMIGPIIRINKDATYPDTTVFGMVFEDNYIDSYNYLIDSEAKIRDFQVLNNTFIAPNSIHIEGRNFGFMKLAHIDGLLINGNSILSLKYYNAAYSVYSILLAPVAGFSEFKNINISNNIIDGKCNNTLIRCINYVSGITVNGVIISNNAFKEKCFNNIYEDGKTDAGIASFGGVIHWDMCNWENVAIIGNVYSGLNSVYAIESTANVAGVGNLSIDKIAIKGNVNIVNDVSYETGQNLTVTNLDN